MTNDTRPLTEDTREAIGRVIARWYKTGLLRFNSHDDGSDDLLLRDEIVRALAATRGEPPEPGPAIDVERLARAMHRGRTVGCAWVLHKGERACQVEDHRPDAEAVAAEYDRLRP